MCSVCVKFVTNLSRSKIFTDRTCFSLVMSSSVSISGEAWRKSSLWALTETLSLQMKRRSLSLSFFRMEDRLRLMSWKYKILRLMSWNIKGFVQLQCYLNKPFWEDVGPCTNGLTTWISTHFLLDIIEHKFTKLFLHDWNSSLQRKYELMLKVKFSVCVLTRFFNFLIWSFVVFLQVRSLQTKSSNQCW